MCSAKPRIASRDKRLSAACKGLLSFPRKYGVARVYQACAMALDPSRVRPNSAFGGTAYGTVNAVLNSPRRIQFALKLVY